MAALEESEAMPDIKTKPRHQVADKQRLLNFPDLAGAVTEIRRSSAPDVRFVYRIRVPMDPEPLMVEIREDEFERA